MKKVALILLLLLGGLILYSRFSKPASYNFTFRQLASDGNFLKDEGLKNKVDNVLKDSEGRYGIYIKNLKTGEAYAKGEHDKFEPASFYKVWVLGTVLTKIKEGKLSEDDPITADVIVLNKKFEFSQEDAELKEGVLNFTIKSAIEQMITISHNYAAYALIEKVGRGEIQNFLKKYGLNESSFGTDLESTPTDLGKLFEKIYKAEIIDPEYSQKMIDVLLRQQRNDRIPKYLPDETKVAHKTGELPNIRNDGGIVYSPNGDFIIVVLSETKNVTSASETIAKISEVVYTYFNK